MFEEPRVGEYFQTILERTLRECRALSALIAKQGNRLTAVEDVQMREIQKVLNLQNQPVKLDPQQAAAKAQAEQHLYHPLRHSSLEAFVRRLLNPEDFGYAVTAEVRNAARRALGLPEVKEYDL